MIDLTDDPFFFESREERVVPGVLGERRVERAEPGRERERVVVGGEPQIPPVRTVRDGMVVIDGMIIVINPTVRCDVFFSKFFFQFVFFETQ